MALKWTVAKDPEARKDYGVDWSALLAASETISTAVWTVPTGLTSDGESITGGVTSIWLTGGTAGQSYTVKCKITTSRGMVDERSITLSVKEQ